MQACRRVACSRARVSAGSGPRGMAWPPPRRAWPSPGPSPGLSPGSWLPWPSSVARPSSGSWPSPWLLPEAWPWSWRSSPSPWWRSPEAWPWPWRPAAGGVAAGRAALAGGLPVAAAACLAAVAVGGGVVVGVQGQPGGGEVVQGLPVDLAGHHRGEDRITRGGFGGRAGQVHRSGAGRGAGGGPGAFQDGAAAQVVQVHVDGQVRGLAVPAGDHLPGDQPPACFLDRVVAALGRGAGIFRPGLLPERVQHHRQSGGAGGGQVTLRRPAPPNVVSSHSARSSNPPSSPVSGPVWVRSSISRASRARSC